MFLRVPSHVHPYDAHDVQLETLTTKLALDQRLIQDPDLKRDAPLPHINAAQAVACGRLYIRNDAGEYEQVLDMGYWKDDQLLSVTSSGYEYNEDGATTRHWEPVYQANGH